MSARTAEPVLDTTDWLLDLPNNAPSRLPQADSGIDDPVNDTGLGPLRGDLQLSDEFACLLSMICEESGEFA